MNKGIPEEENTREKINFVSQLQSQRYEELKRQKEKWTDDLFTPDESSIFSGKTEFSNYKAPEIPKFLKVKFQLTKLG
jgi:hypothetical protein